MPAYAALLLIELHFPEAGSLKAKRKELSSTKALLQTRLGCAVSETDHHDKWQRAQLAAALTGGDLGLLEAHADRVERWLWERHPAGVRIERSVLSFDEVPE